MRKQLPTVTLIVALAAAVVWLTRDHSPQPVGSEPRRRRLLQQAGFTPLRSQVAPPLDVKDMNGGARSLAQLRGRVVLLNFWGTTCLPCLAELPTLERLHDEFRDQGLVVFSVC